MNNLDILKKIFHKSNINVEVSSDARPHTNSSQFANKPNNILHCSNDVRTNSSRISSGHSLTSLIQAYTSIVNGELQVDIYSKLRGTIFNSVFLPKEDMHTVNLDTNSEMDATICEYFTKVGELRREIQAYKHRVAVMPEHEYISIRNRLYPTAVGQYHNKPAHADRSKHNRCIDSYSVHVQSVDGRPLSSVIGNRAACKLREIMAELHIWPYIFSHILSYRPHSTRQSRTLFQFIDLCGGPGSFSQYLFYEFPREFAKYIQSDKYTAGTVHNKWTVHGYGLSLKESFPNAPNTWYPQLYRPFTVHLRVNRANVLHSAPIQCQFHPIFGIMDNGDIMDQSNINSYLSFIYSQTSTTISTVVNPVHIRPSAIEMSTYAQGEQSLKGVLLAVSDGGFNIEGDQLDYQEVLTGKLIFAEFYCTLLALRVGGCAIIKLFDMFTSFIHSIVYMATLLFDEIYIIKPLHSRVMNSERYLVCKGYIVNISCVSTKEPEQLHPISVYSFKHNADIGCSNITRHSVEGIECTNATRHGVQSSEIVDLKRSYSLLFHYLTDVYRELMRSDTVYLHSLVDLARMYSDTIFCNSIFPSIISIASDQLKALQRVTALC